MMYKKRIITAAVATQLLLIFFYIYTQNKIIQLTYTIQETEITATHLKKRKSVITHEFLQLQESNALKNYAVHDLMMKKARITDIKTVSVAHD